MRITVNNLLDIIRESLANEYSWCVSNRENMKLNEPGMEDVDKDNSSAYLKSMALMEGDIKLTKRQLRRIIHEEMTSERLAPAMGKNTGKLTYIDPGTQETIDFLEKELGTSSFFDEVMERLSIDQMKNILGDIQREYGFGADGIKRI